MNVLVILPLIAFFVNILLALYIIYRDSKHSLNRIYSFFLLSLAIWSIGSYLTFSASSIDQAMFWSKLEGIGISLAPFFLLYFFLFFVKKLPKKIGYQILLFLPALFFIIVNLTTDLLNSSTEATSWGFNIVRGAFYPLITIYAFGSAYISIFISYFFYLKNSSAKEKKMTKYFVLAVLIPGILGLVPRILASSTDMLVYPITPFLTTIMGIIIGYALIKFGPLTQKTYTIQKKLVIGFLIISLLSGAVGYLSINITREGFEKEIGENSVLLNHQLMDKIDRNIYYKIEELQIHSSDLVLQEVLLKSNQEFENLSDVQDYINEIDLNWTSVSKETITPFMQELLNNTFSAELREKIEFYEEKYGYLVFGEIFVTNKYGANVALTGKTSDYRQDDESWWLNAVNDSLYVGDVEYDESAGVYSISICMRIDDEARELLGVMKAVLNLEEIINIILELESSKGYRLTHFDLINKDFELIYSTKKEFEIFEDVSDEEHVIKAQNEDEGHYIIKCENTGNEELFANTHSKGYRDYKGVGWILTAMVNVDEAFVSVEYMTNLMIVIVLVIVILGFLFGIIFSRSISKPIIKLKNVAAKMGEGDLDIKIDIKSKDEVGDLATSFGKMAESLKLQYENLESLVGKRTKELETKVDELQRFKKVTVNRELKMVELKKKIKELEDGAKK